MQSQTGQYAFDLDATGKFDSIEDAKDKLETLADHARELGLSIDGGHVAIVREREPIASFRLGSDQPFRNMTSQEGTPQAARFERTMTTA